MVSPVGSPKSFRKPILPSPIRATRNCLELAARSLRGPFVSCIYLLYGCRVSNIAIIPARSGSTRVPNKNVVEFRGIPMLMRTIETLKTCTFVDRIIVTTDSQEYADLAVKCGAEIPFLRSASLAGDSSNTIDVVVDVIERVHLSSGDKVACVYATNPLLDSRIIDLGNRLLERSSGNSYVTPIVKYGFPPQRSISMKNQYEATMTNSEFMYEHSQNLVSLFHECAQFWWAYAATWLSGAGMQEKIIPIILKEWMQQDIDTIDDWVAAEAKYDYRASFPQVWDQEIAKIITKYLPS